MSTNGEFGPFERLCETGGYLPLLGMHSAECAGVLKSIADAVRSTPDFSRDVDPLFVDRNWRGHLIALAAVLLSREPAEHARKLWRTFDRGSWVAPQLAVAIYWADPGFVAAARRRIAGRCPIEDDENFFQGHTRGASAKNLASLLRVMAYVPSEASWVLSQHAMPDVKELLNADCDSAGDIVESWHDAALARFQESGYPIG